MRHADEGEDVKDQHMIHDAGKPVFKLVGPTVWIGAIEPAAAERACLCRLIAGEAALGHAGNRPEFGASC